MLIKCERMLLMGAVDIGEVLGYKGQIKSPVFNRAYI